MIEETLKYLKENNYFSYTDISFGKFIERIGNICPYTEMISMILSNELSKGHICINIDSTITEWNHKLSTDNYYIDEKIIKEKILLNKLVGKKGDYLPLIYDNKYLYLHRYFTYECLLADKINKLLKVHLSHKNLIIENKNQYEIDYQFAARISSQVNNFSIISGGPGTGKTHTLSRILSDLLADNENPVILLAAPTGKAAARMNESLESSITTLREDIKQKLVKLKAVTIHRLLGVKKNEYKFIHNIENKLNCNILVIDEASMIDISLTSKLFSAIKDDCRVILLGDKNQLSSVEAGSVFADICEAFPENRFNKSFIDTYNSVTGSKICITPDKKVSPHIFLSKSRRFSEDSGIGKITNLINKNLSEKHISNIIDSLKNNSFNDIKLKNDFNKKGSADNFKSKTIENYKKLLSSVTVEEGLKALENYKVLCGVKKGKYGTYYINELIKDIFIQTNSIKESDIFFENQPIIILKNNYELELYNGDTGIIRKGDDGKYKAWFKTDNNTIKSFIPNLLPEYETSFAITIHKSQGSEYENIDIILPEKDNNILTRELIYTAISRAKKSVTIYSSDESLKNSLIRKTIRYSGLTQRIMKT